MFNVDLLYEYFAVHLAFKYCISTLPMQNTTFLWYYSSDADECMLKRMHALFHNNLGVVLTKIIVAKMHILCADENLINVSISPTGFL